MTLFDAIILGTVQGLTEFLPVSSSGHLVLFQNLLGLSEPMIAFDIAVHWGTLTAVLIFFIKDICLIAYQTVQYLIAFPFSKDRQALLKRYPLTLMTGLIIIASIPTAIIGYVFKDAIAHLFGSIAAVGAAWFFTGILLIMSKRFQNGDRELSLMNQRDAFLIGMAQGIAIIPGVSRSGSTILAGMLCGLERQEAARFSFLIAIPAIVGAGLLHWKEESEWLMQNQSVIWAGFFSSAVVGYLAIIFLLKLTRWGKFYWFGYYCVALSLVAFGYSVFR